MRFMKTCLIAAAMIAASSLAYAMPSGGHGMGDWKPR